MSKFIVTTFPDEKKAYHGLSTLEELHAEGNITLYSTLVVQRQADGTLITKQRTPEVAIGASLGSLLGALVGAFGGPAGALVGMAAGGAAGGLPGLVQYQVSEEFIEDIGKDLQPGMFAVLAEASEGWTAPVDTRMEALGGKVRREDRDDVVEELLERRVEASRAAFDQKKVAHQSRKAERMEVKLEEEIGEAREKLQRTAEKARKRLDQTKEEMSAKLWTLEQQASKATPETKRQIDSRIAEIRSEFAEREKKLAHAWDIAQEALHP
jgi:uncharacterized membrane protein